MAQKNNKYTPYILSTVGYIIAVLFVLGDEETTSKDRFAIVYFWGFAMFVVLSYKTLNKK